MISDVMKKVMTGAEPNQAIKTSAAPGDYSGGNAPVGATGIRPGGGGMPGMSGNTMISQGRGPAIGAMPTPGIPKTQSAGGFPSAGVKPKPGSGANKANTEKALFLAALHAAIDKAMKNPSFNLSSAVAEAVAKLNALGKDKGAMDKLHHVVDNSAQAQRELKQMLDQMMNTTKQIINNV